MKSTTLAILIAVFLIGGAFLLSSGSSAREEIANGSNVTTVDGTQIVEIKAKGKYLPRKSIAKAGIPTVLRFDTNGTFDCTASVRIPSMNISQILPPTGSTDIAIGSPSMATLQGTCGMGMYPFEVEFKS